MTDTMIQDGDQIVESKGNDQELKEQAVLLYDGVIKFVYARTKDREATFDIGQNVMEVAVSKIEKLRRADSLKSWLMKITANQIHDYFRKMKFEQSHTVPKTEEDEAFPEVEDIKADILEHLIDGESKDNAIKAMFRLDSKYQEVILYHVICEWPLIKIAEKRNMNYNTVRIRYTRGIKKLKELFLEIEEEKR